MPVKEIFAKSFAVYKKNFANLFLPLLVLQLVLLLPLLFFTMPGTVNAARALLISLSSFSQTGTGISAMLYVFAFIVLALLFFSPLVISNTVYVISKDMQGKQVGFRRSFAFSKGNYGKMLGSYFAGLTCGMPLILAVVLLLYDTFANRLDPALLNGGDYALIALAAALVLLYLLGSVFLPFIAVVEGKWGFKALFSSFKYVYTDFWANLGRLGLAALLLLGLASAINWLAQLPFEELFYLYLENPAAALKEPLMVFAIVLSIAAIVLVAFLLPFWYAFSFNTYRGARQNYLMRFGEAEKTLREDAEGKIYGESPGERDADIEM